MCRTRLIVAAVVAASFSACSSKPTGTGENSAPVVTLVSPVPATTFAGGDNLAITITGRDAEDGALAAGSLSKPTSSIVCTRGRWMPGVWPTPRSWTCRRD